MFACCSVDRSYDRLDNNNPDDLEHLAQVRIDTLHQPPWMKDDETQSCFECGKIYYLLRHIYSFRSDQSLKTR